MLKGCVCVCVCVYEPHTPEVATVEVPPEGGVSRGSVEVSVDGRQGQQGAHIQQPQHSQQQLWRQDRQAEHRWERHGCWHHQRETVSF